MKCWVFLGENMLLIRSLLLHVCCSVVQRTHKAALLEDPSHPLSLREDQFSAKAICSRFGKPGKMKQLLTTEELPP